MIGFFLAYIYLKSQEKSLTDNNKRLKSEIERIMKNNEIKVS